MASRNDYAGKKQNFARKIFEMIENHSSPRILIPLKDKMASA